MSDKLNIQQISDKISSYYYDFNANEREISYLEICELYIRRADNIRYCLSYGLMGADTATHLLHILFCQQHEGTKMNNLLAALVCEFKASIVGVDDKAKINGRLRSFGKKLRFEYYGELNDIDMENTLDSLYNQYGK